MSKSGTMYWWCGRFSLLALGLGAALVLPTTACAQTEQIQAQKERDLAQIRAKIDALTKEAAGDTTLYGFVENDDGRTEIVQLKAKIAEAMKARAAAEFSGYAQEVEKDRAVAQLKRLEAVQFAQAGERQQAETELRRAEAAIQQKMAEVRELEAKIRAASERMKAAEAAAKQRAGETAGQQRFRVEYLQNEKAEEITLRKVNGKWEIVAPKVVRAAEQGKVTWEVMPGNERARIAVSPGGPPPASGNPIEYRQAIVARVEQSKTPPPVVAIINRSEPGKAAPPLPASTNSRLDELEKKMDKVMQELEQIRRDMNRSRSGVAPEGNPDRVRVIIANDVEAIQR